MQEILRSKGQRAAVYATIEAAVDGARAEANAAEDAVVCAFGSLYCIGAVTAHLQREKGEQDGQS